MATKVNNLYNIVENMKLSNVDETLLEEIKDALTELLFDVQDREPLSCGERYYRWSEKFQELDNIVDELDDMIKNFSTITEEDIKNFKDNIEIYQIQYRGLKTIKI